MNVWNYGDDINTDMLFPGRYTYTFATAEEITPHLLEDLDADFAGRVQKGDVIFAGKNFGCGSSREQPALGLQAVGIQAIIAKSFSRIFYRAAINQGLILIDCPAAVDALQPDSKVHLDFSSGRIYIDDHEYEFPPLPREISAIREAGGLLPYVREKLKQREI